MSDRRDGWGWDELSCWCWRLAFALWTFVGIVGFTLAIRGAGDRQDSMVGGAVLASLVFIGLVLGFRRRVVLVASLLTVLTIITFVVGLVEDTPWWSVGSDAAVLCLLGIGFFARARAQRLSATTREGGGTGDGAEVR